MGRCLGWSTVCSFLPAGAQQAAYMTVRELWNLLVALLFPLSPPRILVQALASRRSLVYNAYDAMAVAAYLRASGCNAKYKLSWTDTTVTEDWTVG